MKKLMILAALGLAVSMVACGEDDTDTGGSGGDAGGNVGGDGGGGSGGEPLDLSTPAAIAAFLEGKTILMEGDDIPSHPNGYNEDQNFGAATQCYNSTEITINGGVWAVESQLGTLNNAPNVLDIGECDHDTIAGPAAFNSTNVLIENVEGNAECFDITVTYTGFGQEGRGRISADGQTVELELFFATQATGHRCADGDVGATGVTVQTLPFTGDAVQTYRVQ